MPKQYVYESQHPGRIGIRKTVRMFDPVSREPIITPGIHVEFERHQTEPDGKGRYSVYGIATIGEQFCDDNNITLDQAHELLMHRKIKRIFGDIKVIIGPNTVVPDFEATPPVDEMPKPKAKK